MYSILNDNNFVVYLEEVEGKNWIHFECKRFTTSSYKLILSNIEPTLEELGSLYGSIEINNKKMRRLVEHLKFKHICNIATKDGIRAIYVREK